MGYHVASTINFFIGLQRTHHAGDFKMLIHHLCTIMLIFGGYCANIINGATATLFVCDSTDVLFSLSRFLNYTVFDHTMTFVFLGNIMMWAYCRLYVYTF